MSLSDKVLCFTGALADSRASCTAQARAAGASVSASVTAKTTHLVAGPGAGSKVDAAKAKGVIVWTEDEFFGSLNGASGSGPAAKAVKAAPPSKAKGKRKAEAANDAPAAAAPSAKAAKGADSLAGQVLCFSGTLRESRVTCAAQAQAAGASVTASVTAKTTRLVAGPGAGSKVDAAKAKGVIVWTEDEFFAAMSGGGGGVALKAAAPKAAVRPKGKGKAAAAAKSPASPEAAAMRAENAVARAANPRAAAKATKDVLGFAERGNVAGVETCIFNGAEVDVEKDSEGRTALLLASQYGHANVVVPLLAAEANIELQSTDGRTALMWASSRGHANVVELLRAAGARR